MSRKILFSDFDGTLFISGKVSEQDREAIRRWRAEGNLFAMASGRHLTPLKKHLEEEAVEYDYLLCLNGAEAFDSADERIFEIPLDISLLAGLYHTIVQEDGWAHVCYGARGERICTANCSDYNADHVHYSEDRLSTFSRFTQICSAARDKSTEGAIEIKNRVLARYGDFVSAEVNGWSIDINAKDVNKAAGIEKLIAAIGITPENVFTVGDNFNDLSMLTAYCGCAMERAPEAVKRKTGRTAHSVGEWIDSILGNLHSEIRYDKLVRDRIPEIIAAEGFTPIVRTLDEAEYLAELHRKLHEEVGEYLRDESIDEIADILEVLEAICAAKGFSMQNVLQVKDDKRKARGGFDGRVFLVSKQ